MQTGSDRFGQSLVLSEKNRAFLHHVGAESTLLLKASSTLRAQQGLSATLAPRFGVQS